MKYCGICLWTKRLNIALHQDIIARYTQIVKNILQGISINVSFLSFKISGEIAFRKPNNPLIFWGKLIKEAFAPFALQLKLFSWRPTLPILTYNKFDRLDLS